MKHFVFAGNHQEAHTFARLRGFKQSDWVFVSGDHVARGLRNPTVYICGRAHLRSDYDRVMVAFKCAEADFIHSSIH